MRKRGREREGRERERAREKEREGEIKKKREFGILNVFLPLLSEYSVYLPTNFSKHELKNNLRRHDNNVNFLKHI